MSFDTILYVDVHRATADCVCH